MALPADSAFAQNGSIVARFQHDGDLTDSTSTNDLTNNGPVTFASAQFDAQAGVYASAGGDYGSDADAASNSWTGDLSGHVWLNRSINPTTSLFVKSIASKYTSAGNQRAWGWNIQNISGGLYHYFIASSDGSATTSKTVALSNTALSTDILFGFSYDASAGSVTFYEDGVKIGATQTGLPTSLHNSTYALEVGRWGNQGQSYDGTMQDMIFWTAALSDAEHTANYAAYTASPFTPKAIVF